MATILQTTGEVIQNAGHQIQHHSTNIGNQLGDTTNRMLPPKQREQIIEKGRDYAQKNPKTAAFLITQAALVGLPLILFIAFAVTTLLVSLTTCLLLGLLVSLATTFLVVGFALLFVIPTVFVASCSATFIFIWGFVGYLVLRRLNEGEAPAKPGTRVGDTLQALTGGRSAYWLGDEASAQGSKHGGKVGHVSYSEGGTAGTGNFQSRATKYPGDDGPVNGVNGTHGVIEWEKKWDGVKTEPVVLETDNVFEVLKADAPIS
ncbi:heterokaryon incompatibility [Pyrenophora seminiperda CCB06]|uniref:Heterokaryon incompatibility n=1 Tax=Pyrenophora seminiperda CCB06 TaxID=1302712 RepID=A0A3M7MFN2_9PLEO|nr:heterokaryon incompatibility [Pyrenophora seminiperda CCB06]